MYMINILVECFIVNSIGLVITREYEYEYLLISIVLILVNIWKMIE